MNKNNRRGERVTSAASNETGKPHNSRNDRKKPKNTRKDFAEDSQERKPREPREPREPLFKDSDEDILKMVTSADPNYYELPQEAATDPKKFDKVPLRIDTLDGKNQAENQNLADDADSQDNNVKASETKSNPASGKQKNLTTNDIISLIQREMPDFTRGSARVETSAYDEKGKSKHMPLIDGDDDLQITEMEVANLDQAILRNVALEEGSQPPDFNKVYFKGEQIIKEKYGFNQAKIPPKDSVPLKRAFEFGEKHNRVEVSKFGIASAVEEVVADGTKKRRIEKEAREKLKKQAQADMIENELANEETANAIKNQQKAIISLGQVLLTEKLTHSEKLGKAQAEYFLPDNCTEKALSFMALDMIEHNKDPSKGPFFCVPHRNQIQAIAEKNGLDTVEDLIKTVREGLKTKNIRHLKKLSNQNTDVQTEAVRRLREKRETKLAKRQIPKAEIPDHDTEHIDIEVESGDDASQQIDKINEVLSAKNSEMNFIPFVYDLQVSYSILYYTYAASQNSKLPFGKTLPDIAWVYVFGLYLDPTNTLGLRQKMDRYIIKIGGVGLLSAVDVHDKPGNELLKKLIKNTYGGAAAGTTKDMVVSASTALYRAQEKRIMLMQKKLKLSEALENISAANMAATRLAVSKKLVNKSPFSEILNRCNIMVTVILGTDEETKRFKAQAMRFAGIEEKHAILTLNNALGPISFETMYMANMMLRMALKQEELELKISDDWFIEAMSRNSGGIVDRFGYIVSVLDDNIYIKAMNHIFGGEENVRIVKDALVKASNARLTTDMSLVKERMKKFDMEKPEFYRWSSADTVSVKVENPLDSMVVEEGIKQMLKEDYESTDVPEGPDSYIKLQEQMKSGSQDEIPLPKTSPPRRVEIPLLLTRPDQLRLVPRKEFYELVRDYGLTLTAVMAVMVMKKIPAMTDQLSVSYADLLLEIVREEPAFKGRYKEVESEMGKLDPKVPFNYEKAEKASQLVSRLVRQFQAKHKSHHAAKYYLKPALTLATILIIANKVRRPGVGEPGSN